MSSELAIIVIHGMGSQKTDYAEAMIREIDERVSNLGKDTSQVGWRPIFWADVLEDRQLKYLRDAERQGDLDFIRLRRFVLTAFCDASAYQRVTSSFNTTYEEIHARIRKAMKELYEIQLQSKAKPLIVMAHSLGGHIISNYIWDMQKKKDPALSPFERMERLAGIVTFGCNMPLFTFAYKKVTPIKFPATQLSAATKKKAKWLNFYDPDDILGYPIKPINAEYRKVVTKDIAINVGGILSSWNPASHSNYWTDNDFTKPVAKFIASFL